MDLSILIATRGRADSLGWTLDALARDIQGFRVEIVVIENDPLPTLAALALARTSFVGVRLLHEPRPGKASALNRAIDTVRLAPLVAVLDDDMTPAAGWCAAAIKAAQRLPGYALFSGRSHVIWPEAVPRPAWSEHGFALGVAFSVYDAGSETDCEMGTGVIRFPSGNHFWFRRNVLSDVPHFPDVWAPEADFAVLVRMAGHAGVFVPEVLAGHRIQPQLISTSVFLSRAVQFGRVLARVEALEHRSPRSTLRRLASAGLAGVRGVGWRMAGATACLLPRASGVPLRARAACSAARYFARARSALAGHPQVGACGTGSR